jgi:putative pyrroloquinoline-quinone binding quinoprotein
VPGRRVVSGARGRLLAINADGTLAWTFKSGHDFDPLSRPALSADGRLYTLGALKPITYGLTPDGKPTWTFDAGYYTNPLQVDSNGRVYLTISGKLFVRDADGERLWTYGEPTAYRPNVPIAFDGDGATYVAGMKLAAVGADGAVRWESALATDALGCVATGAIIRNDVIYFGCGDRFLAYGRDGSKRWEVKTETTVAGTAIAEDGTVYAVATNLYALNVDGTVRWQFTPEQPYSTRPSIGSDGTIYVASRHQVHAVRPDGKLLWQTTAGREEASSPSGPQLRWLDGALLFSSGHQTAYQIESARLEADKGAWQ